MCTPNAMSSTLIKETLVKLKNTHCTPDNISSTPLPHQWKVPGNKNKKDLRELYYYINPNCLEIKNYLEQLNNYK